MYIHFRLAYNSSLAFRVYIYNIHIYRFFINLSMMRKYIVLEALYNTVASIAYSSRLFLIGKEDIISDVLFYPT
jgi:hypothetical protein